MLTIFKVHLSLIDNTFWEQSLSLDWCNILNKRKDHGIVWGKGTVQIPEIGWAIDVWLYVSNYITIRQLVTSYFWALGAFPRGWEANRMSFCCYSFAGSGQEHRLRADNVVPRLCEGSPKIQYQL